ncbi:hypothetical protein CXG81DRAFT_12549 [Caulochytrium protostelioides]|uniref:Tubulin nucleotide-binding domain-like protein n=1 Tax=Caulochytrium protostelioides TaxID=1555241 RepID=A0A4P9WUQ0_9FUNG|nr:tubulin nucleotide-binding domain-like protein [Caulochytrium protostelioides]RKP00989.1 hypothetical protein CXG81DRAFT_12549 [Caulochytrium protostelioides]|eukprot:RKP00989.1 hypothetical protein CXG81DRAFT_12549 [Caulochytrium protostelioides]
MIVLQVGQCGIQVGQALFDQLQQEVPPARGAAWCPFPLNQFQQILVDTERKVWSARQHQAHQHALYDLHVVDHGVTGRGNNWGHGYIDATNVDATLETYRRVVEALPNNEGTLLLHSLAGGTGSGLGSSLCEHLREMDPKKVLISGCVTPFIGGETTLQHYNSLLALATLQGQVDMIHLFQNDTLQKDLQGGLGKGVAASGKGLFDRLNEQIAVHVLGMVLPRVPVQPNGMVARHVAPWSAWQTIQNVVPLPACKHAQLWSVRSAPSAPNTPQMASWPDLWHHLLRAFPVTEPRRSCMASELYVRGIQGSEYWQTHHAVLPSRLYMRLGHLGLLAPTFYASSLQGLRPTDTTRSATVCANTSDGPAYVANVLHRARTLYDSGAFLHWYERFLGSDTSATFEAAFDSLETVVQDYRTLLMR